MKQIYLGYANGWNQQTRDLFNQLNNKQIEGTLTNTEVSNCNHKYSFQSIQDDEIVEVTYMVDSGD